MYLSYVQRNIPPGKLRSEKHSSWLVTFRETFLLVREIRGRGTTADVYLSYVQRNIPPGKLRSEKHSSWLVTFRETFLLVSYVQRNIPPG